MNMYDEILNRYGKLLQKYIRKNDRDGIRFIIDSIYYRLKQNDFPNKEKIWFQCYSIMTWCDTHWDALTDVLKTDRDVIMDFGDELRGN